MMTMIELLLVVTLTLSLVSSPSDGRLHRTQIIRQVLDTNDHLQPPATVSQHASSVFVVLLVLLSFYSTSASDCLERIAPEMTSDVLSGT